MFDRREHPQSGPGADRHRWFAAKLFVAIVVTIVAAYVTAILRIEHVRQNMLNLLERGRGPPVGRRGYVESAPEPGLRAQDHGHCGAFEESCTRCFRVFR